MKRTSILQTLLHVVCSRSIQPNSWMQVRAGTLGAKCALLAVAFVVPALIGYFTLSATLNFDYLTQNQVHGDGSQFYPIGGVYGDNWDTFSLEPFSRGIAYGYWLLCFAYYGMVAASGYALSIMLAGEHGEFEFELKISTHAIGIYRLGKLVAQPFAAPGLRLEANDSSGTRVVTVGGDCRTVNLHLLAGVNRVSFRSTEKLYSASWALGDYALFLEVGNNSNATCNG